MPISTEFVRFCKAVEQFYYIMVIASDTDRTKVTAAWRAWLAGGLNPAVRLAPPVDAENRIKVNSRPGVGGFDVTVSGANREALARLRSLLTDIDAAHKSLAQSDSDEARLASLMDVQAVIRELVRPLGDSATRSQIPADGVDSFMAMIRRGLSAVAAKEITSLAITLT